MKKRLLLSVWLLVCSSALQMKAADTNSGPHSIPALQTAIESVLKETKTPGAAIAIITSNKLDWLAGLGKADVAANQPVTPDTLFQAPIDRPRATMGAGRGVRQSVGSDQSRAARAFDGTHVGLR